MNTIGRKQWAIPEGYIPAGRHGPEPAMLSHECVCILNAGETPANVTLTVFYTDRAPVKYRLTVPAERTKHVRFNNLTDPEKIPVATEFSSVIESDVPVVCQHTRLDSRQSENALLSTIAFPGDDG